MGWKKKIQARAMGISPQMYEIIERLQPHFAKSGLLQNDPEKSMAVLEMFASAHGKASEQLTSREVDDFIAVLTGIEFPIHPDEMARNGKFGCEACRATYIELWKIVTQPILDQIERGEKPPMPSDKEMRDMVGRLGESEKFLSE